MNKEIQPLLTYTLHQPGYASVEVIVRKPLIGSADFFRVHIDTGLTEQFVGSTANPTAQNINRLVAERRRKIDGLKNLAI